MNDTEASYRAYWATLTDRSEREVYVPLALREPKGLRTESGEPVTFEEGEVAILSAESAGRRVA